MNVWYDKWCSVSPLSDFIDTRDIYDARLKNNYTVNEEIKEERWVWPADWSIEFVELGQLQVPTLNDRIKDTAVWISGNGCKKEFKISNVWKDMNHEDERVDWHKLIWFTQNIPRHSFVTWLAIQEKLMTLFESWDQIVSEMKALPLNRNIWSIVRRLVCNVAVYYIWKKRNNRIFKNEKRDKDTVFSMIKDIIAIKLIGLRVKESKTVHEVEEKWKLKLQKEE
ncbi:RNA-directed DNA polymerase, eukaryota, reverse transcriptase zinc-binding domain protein [Tanacetum coccineum]